MPIRGPAGWLERLILGAPATRASVNPICNTTLSNRLRRELSVRVTASGSMSMGRARAGGAQVSQPVTGALAQSRRVKGTYFLRGA